MAAGQEHRADAVRDLQDRLRRHPPDRYPVQHATAAFHLATVHLGEGRPGPAADALRAAVRLFEHLPVERAKALNMLGAAHRALGATDDAAAAFDEAASTFRETGQPLEQAAATYNGGLLAVDRGDDEQAVRAFRDALELFRSGDAIAQASAAGRELGSALLRSGRIDAAVEVLSQAVADAEVAGDLATLGAAANVAGLAHLARGSVTEAEASFRVAASAHPRGVRPDGHAMAKANLALAHERGGDAPRARLAARQARDTPGAPAPAVRQARAVLDRTGDADDDLFVVLDDEPEEQWPAVVRDELDRWADTTADEQRAAAAALVHGHLQRPRRAVPFASIWLGVLLEQPPSATQAVVERIVEALDTHDEASRSRFRSDVARAMAMFHVPQLVRLQQLFQEASARIGDEAAWN